MRDGPIVKAIVAVCLFGGGAFFVVMVEATIRHILRFFGPKRTRYPKLGVRT